MIEAIFEGIGRALAGPGLLIIIAGTLYGMLVGVIPGISGAVGIILLIPLTFAWPLDHALLLFAAAWGGSSYGGKWAFTRAPSTATSSRSPSGVGVVVQTSVMPGR